MNIANRVSKYLQAVGYVTKVFSYDGLGEIVDDANAWDADLFVSIHCNAATGTARGTETYTTGSVEGTKLAKAIQNQLLKKIPETVDRGVKVRGFYVIKYANAPAVLIETAFIDNPTDAKLLVENEDDFARAIAVGITDYVGGKVKPMPDVVDVPKTKASTKLSEHFDRSEFDSHRCPTHNANVGGVPNSQHVLGTAADLAIPLKMTLKETAKKINLCVKIAWRIFCL